MCCVVQSPGSVSKQGRARPHAQTQSAAAGGAGSNAIHSIADLAEAEDGLAAAHHNASEAGANDADNAFVLPKEDVFLLREREHKQRRDARDRALKQKIWLRSTAPPASSIAAAASVKSRAPPPVAQSIPTATQLPSRRGRGMAAVGGGSSSTATENMAEFIAKKRVMFLIQTSLDTKNQEIQKLEEKAAMKEDALRKSEEMLAEDAGRFNKFLEENDNKVKQAIYQADRAAKKKNKKHEKIKKLHASITRINTRIQKQKAAQLKYEEYESFLKSLLPREVKQRIEELRAAREKAAKERPQSGGLESRASSASLSNKQSGSGGGAGGAGGANTTTNTAAGSGGFTTSTATTIPAPAKKPAPKSSKPPKVPTGLGMGGFGVGLGGTSGGATGLESDADSDDDDDSDDDAVGTGLGGAGGGGDAEDDDAEDDDDEEDAPNDDDSQRIGSKQRSDDPNGDGGGGGGGAAEDDPEVTHWSDPETLFEMFEHLEEEILFKMQNVHEAEASLEALKVLKLETEQKMAAQRAQLNQNIADVRAKIAAERAKVAAIRLRYQTGEDTKRQEAYEAVRSRSSHS